MFHTFHTVTHNKELLTLLQTKATNPPQNFSQFVEHFESIFDESLQLHHKYPQDSDILIFLLLLKRRLIWDQRPLDLINISILDKTDDFLVQFYLMMDGSHIVLNVDDFSQILSQIEEAGGAAFYYAILAESVEGKSTEISIFCYEKVVSLCPDAVYAWRKLLSGYLVTLQTDKIEGVISRVRGIGNEDLAVSFEGMFLASQMKSDLAIRTLKSSDSILCKFTLVILSQINLYVMSLEESKSILEEYIVQYVDIEGVAIYTALMQYQISGLEQAIKVGVILNDPFSWLQLGSAYYSRIIGGSPNWVLAHIALSTGLAVYPSVPHMYLVAEMKSQGGHGLTSDPEEAKEILEMLLSLFSEGKYVSPYEFPDLEEKINKLYESLKEPESQPTKWLKILGIAGIATAIIGVSGYFIYTKVKNTQ